MRIEELTDPSPKSRRKVALKRQGRDRHKETIGRLLEFAPPRAGDATFHRPPQVEQIWNHTRAT